MMQENRISFHCWHAWMLCLHDCNAKINIIGWIFNIIIGHDPKCNHLFSRALDVPTSDSEREDMGVKWSKPLLKSWGCAAPALSTGFVGTGEVPHFLKTYCIDDYYVSLTREYDLLDVYFDTGYYKAQILGNQDQMWFRSNIWPRHKEKYHGSPNDR